jgi:hypothetical protein
MVGLIKRYGFSFPFFVWKDGGKNWCIDGHGRIGALREIRKRGGQLPPFPVVYVRAKNRAEAKVKLLLLNSQYGRLNAAKLVDFVDGIDVRWDELALPDGSVLSLNLDQLKVRDEWKGMPEFVQNDAGAFRSIIVHFKDQKAVDSFSKTVRQRIGPKTKYIWFPPAEKDITKNIRVKSEP